VNPARSGNNGKAQKLAEQTETKIKFWRSSQIHYQGYTSLIPEGTLAMDIAL
jgi:hypothetical protein